MNHHDERGRDRRIRNADLQTVHPVSRLLSQSDRGCQQTLLCPDETTL